MREGKPFRVAYEAPATQGARKGRSYKHAIGNMFLPPPKKKPEPPSRRLANLAF